MKNQKKHLWQRFKLSAILLMKFLRNNEYVLKKKSWKMWPDDTELQIY